MKDAPLPLTPLPPQPASTPAPIETEPHPKVHSPAVDHERERMKNAAKPNDAEPLSHRNRGKAGRKG